MIDSQSEPRKMYRYLHMQLFLTDWALLAHLIPSFDSISLCWISRVFSRFFLN